MISLFFRYRIHIIAWSAFIFWETFAVWLLFNVSGKPLIYIVHYLIIIGLFYFQSNVLLPFLQKSRARGILILLSFVLFLTVYVFAHLLGDVLLTFMKVVDLKPYYGFNKDFAFRNLYRGIFFMGFSTGYYYLKHYFEERKKSEQLEKEKLLAIISQKDVERQLVITQNAYLKAQINPHFLFNTLDFVYYHIKKQVPLAGEAIIRLSQMMRFALDSDQLQETILLADEIEQVENLIFLNEMRKNGRQMIQITADEEVGELRLIPLVLLTLTENIFKHGKLDDEHTAQISMGIKEDKFYLSTQNSVNAHKKVISHQSGLQNIRERLKYAYQDNFLFKHEQQGDLFLVSLELPVHLLKASVPSAQA